MKTNFISVKTDGAWWRGEIKLRYNLLTLLKCFAIPFIILYYLLKALLDGLMWLCKKVAPFFIWLGLLLCALWDWFIGLFKRKERAVKQVSEKEEKKRNWWWLLLLLLLLLLSLLCLRNCGGEKDGLAIPEETSHVVYQKSFNSVIIARAYLDGVQEKVSSDYPRALVGLKFIEGNSVKGKTFDGLTYDEAVKVLSDEWEPLVVGNLSPSVKLTEQQMAVVTLVAMRMGPKGFPRSTFLQKVNAGDFKAATSWLRLQNADGSVMKTKDEPKQYFYILRVLWEDQIDINELIDYPMFSYKKVTVGQMYKGNQHNFDDNIWFELKRGSFQTPRTALGLD